MAVTITSEDRFPTVDSRLGTVNGKVSITRNTGSLVLELNVIGTHFPALSTNTDAQPAQLTSTRTSDSEVKVNYNDGTGWHTYNSVLSSGSYRLDFIRRSNNEIGVPPTPANISSSAPYAVPVHFYEDLPLPPGTVDDFYNHPRKVLIDISDFANIQLFSTFFLGLHGNLPPTINRFRNIEELRIEFAHHLTGIDVDLTKVFCRVLGFRLLGFSLGNEIPQWILESNSIEVLDMWDMFNFSGQTMVSSRLEELFDGVKLPNLENLSLRDTEIDFEIPNIPSNLIFLNLNDNNSPNMRLSPSLINYGNLESLGILSSSMPASEYERLLSGSDSPISIEMRFIDVNQDITIATPNTNTTRIIFGGNSSFSGEIPTFFADMTVMTTLSLMVNNTNNVVFSNITSWGSAGINNSLETFTVENHIGLPATLPTWFSNLINLQTFNAGFCETQTREDDLVDSFYGIVEANASMTPGSTPFREMNIRFLALTLQRNNSPRPTGTYQQPSGYVQGSANGTPASPMEMIWVLVNQYDSIVTVLNMAGDGIDIYTP